jgi:hypothetical protein
MKLTSIYTLNYVDIKDEHNIKPTNGKWGKQLNQLFIKTRRMPTEFLSENLKGTDRFGVIGVHARIILKCVRGKFSGCGLVLSASEKDRFAGFCKHDNEPSVYVI